ncbi:MAG TPA: hypothetical protein VF008_05625 [Niastella sp.]
MKKYLQFILTATSIVFCSWTMNKPNLVNQNSWSISIGKKVVLASWQNNKLGDTAIIEKKKIKSIDTLFVSQYLCGYNGQNSFTTLTIKNDIGQVIKESTNKNNQLMYIARLSLTDMLTSNKFTNNQILNIYCSIYNKADNINQTLLVGRLQLK